MGFSVGLNKAVGFIRHADGKQNPYTREQAQKDGKVSMNEAGRHFVDLQNSPKTSDVVEEGSFYQTLFVGNNGKGYFTEVANLASPDNKIGADDMLKLAQLGAMSNPENDRMSVDEEDFKTLQAMGGYEYGSNPFYPNQPIRMEAMSHLVGLVQQVDDLYNAMGYSGASNTPGTGGSLDLSLPPLPYDTPSQNQSQGRIDDSYRRLQGYTDIYGQQ